MRRRLWAAFGVALTLSATPARTASEVRIASPGGTLVIRVSADAGQRLGFDVSRAGQPVIERSPLGITLDGQNLGDGAAIGDVTRYEVDETYPWRGVHATAVNRSSGARIAVTHRASGVSYTVDIRAFDDGAAFRFVVPGSPGRSRVPDAASAFRLPAGSVVWVHDLDRGYYEGVHARKPIEALTPGEWVAPPLTVQLPATRGFAAITEAGLRGYAGMALQADGARGFHVRLGHAVPASYPFTLRYKEDVERLALPAAIGGTITTPWRVVIAGGDLHALVTSDIVHNLAPPPDAHLFPAGMRTAWVKPGRAVWKYLDGGENTFEEMRAFSRLAGELGFEYHVIEGFWQRWTPEQLKALVAESAEQGVGIWLWKHSRDLRDPAARAAFFRTCREAGVAGVKIDFFDHDAREVIDRYETLLREAAEAKLLVNFHGASKPTGESRTWPNELTREAVYGLEYRRTETRAAHDVTLPFTRLLAGPADYTPVIFGERRKDTTWAHQIAMAAVFTSPLLTYAAHPASLLANPAVEIIETIPAVWDETRVLPPSAIGEVAVFARRTGSTWFLAIVNGPAARGLRVDLTFLGEGAYEGLLVRDAVDDPAAVRLERVGVTRGTALEIALSEGGGFVGRFSVRQPGPDAR